MGRAPVNTNRENIFHLSNRKGHDIVIVMISSLLTTNGLLLPRRRKVGNFYNEKEMGMHTVFGNEKRVRR